MPGASRSTNYRRIWERCHGELGVYRPSSDAVHGRIRYQAIQPHAGARTLLHVQYFFSKDGIWRLGTGVGEAVSFPPDCHGGGHRGKGRLWTLRGVRCLSYEADESITRSAVSPQLHQMPCPPQCDNPRVTTCTENKPLSSPFKLNLFVVHRSKVTHRSTRSCGLFNKKDHRDKAWRSRWGPRFNSKHRLC